MRVQACLNGARPACFHPGLPLSEAEVARDAAACAEAGAVALHLHPRNARLVESLAPEVIRGAVMAARLSGLPVSVSTGGWIMGDDARRRAMIASWALLGEGRPEEASVNLSEPDAPAVIDALHASGIGVEAGLASVQDAERFLALDRGCRRVLVEVPDLPPDQAVPLAKAILGRLDAAGHGAERQLHGEGRSVWPCFDLAAELGLMARLGLEDGTDLPDGRRADGNVALIRAGLARAARRA
ncbi:putative cytosolic protein [Roseomonas mucosa]|uniref:Uncharacterized conserved protein n=1 Tax=Roseomonas mucosa TaxID=207340 RepID=A0A379N0Y9_9PROT|nr:MULTISPECIES: 3-keto-5-aminohexanoate cleavage protein [Roseomonas]MBS5904020.1 3-keto-5-aminohexanoate cleavage protein [Acetobacteraceae bacterium]MCG7350644.1 3-keto-5-aminohexanoate cleavage protein [Roseomonas mucosa]MCG7358171.1 3-keto-5-aminohexanoate cleavage protein [Roseomonas mucosa]MDT8290279.1 3-keto-5-aminohexanoate cleavage protein [Roseomonas mucosa]MDT8295636.1 3-keto-5-aminohexanoate cleavage protein [Roseomonas mucosa]